MDLTRAAGQTQNAIMGLTQTLVMQTVEAGYTNTPLPPTPTIRLFPSPTAKPQATSASNPPSTGGSDYTITKLTSPVDAGANATLTIKANAGASCFLAYWTPSGTASSAQGLGAKTAGANGVCSWTWKISPNTNPGNGTLGLTVNGVYSSLVLVIK